MPLKIKVLQAAHGDAIVVETEQNGEKFRILIDGGPIECFERKLGRLRTVPGPLKCLLDEMDARRERFDLTILTHVDDDHIAGLLRAFRDERYRPILAKDVWFNSGRLMAQTFGEPTPPESAVVIDDFLDRKTSIAQGVELDDLLDKYCSSARKIRTAGSEFTFKHGKITVLSPTEAQLLSLLKKWEKEKPDSLTSASQTDYHLSMSQLKSRDSFVEDTSTHNASSIAFLLEVGEAKALFLGDALSTTVCQTLRDKLGVSERHPLAVKVCKLSHHGSKANTNDELLSLVRSDRFIVSTNGLKHGLPNKMTLARISHKSPDSEVLFNYPAVRARVFPNEKERASAINMRDLEGDLLL
jgi:beta-lactamase superfamily II metal-dependent hydrolase